MECYIDNEDSGQMQSDKLNASKKAAGGSSVKTVRLPMKRSVGGQLIMTFR